MQHALTDRETRILEAVIRTYVETAEPAGSRTVAKRYGLGVSPATVRNAMSDLEDKGYLYHPHTSAGRIPTDLAYRYYVDALMRPRKLTTAEQRLLRKELKEEREAQSPLDRVLRRALQVLGLITGELSLAVAPGLDKVELEKFELVSVSEERILLVLTLKNGVIRTVYVDLPARAPAQALTSVSMILNERLAGRTLQELRVTLADRLRDSGEDAPSQELVNIFLQSAGELLKQPSDDTELMLGPTSVVANQPEFSETSRLRGLIELTEQTDLLKSVLESRPSNGSPTITIGSEHGHPQLSPFTLVTSEYRFGELAGVLGVMGPTRMPYEKVAAIVEYTSQLMTELANTSGVR